MQLERYTYRMSNNLLDYEFISKGPQGKIKKAVRFTRIGNNLYNLAFGDIDKMTGEINDTSTTNYGDSQKILATVAAVTHDFLLQYPRSIIIAKGINKVRTRRYRMAITIYWEFISIEFELFGLTNNYWEPFIFNRDYEAFLIHREKM